MCVCVSVCDTTLYGYFVYNNHNFEGCYLRELKRWHIIDTPFIYKYTHIHLYIHTHMIWSKRTRDKYSFNGFCCTCWKLNFELNFIQQVLYPCNAQTTCCVSAYRTRSLLSPTIYFMHKYRIQHSNGYK